MAEGIEVRHRGGCPALDDGTCRCRPAYRAAVYSQRDGRTIRRTFPTSAAAKAWRADAIGQVRRGALRVTPNVTIFQASAAWLEGARDGSIRTRSGSHYRPSAIRAYEHALELRILPELGGARLGELSRPDVQAFVDRLLAKDLDPSTIRNALMPLRVIYRRAVARGEVAVNPTTGVELPAVRGRRERIASPEEAAALLERSRARRPAGLGDGPLRRPAPRRAHGPALGGCRPRRWRPARRTLVGPAGPPARRGQDPRRAPPRADRRRAARPPRRPQAARWADRRPGVRRRRHAVRLRRPRRPCQDRVEGGEARADRPSRGPAHVRVADDRRRCQREGALDVPRARLDRDHVRPLRAPDARATRTRPRGCSTPTSCVPTPPPASRKSRGPIGSRAVLQGLLATLPNEKTRTHHQ